MSEPQEPIIWPISIEGPVPVDADGLSEGQRIVLGLHGQAFYDFAEGDDKALQRFANELAEMGMDPATIVPGIELAIDADLAYDLLVSGQLNDYNLYSRER